VRWLRPGVWFWLAVAAFVIGGYILYPALAVVRQSVEGQAGGWTWAHYARFFSSEPSANLVATWNSIWISLASVGGAALLGVPLALLMTTFEFPGRRLCGALVMMPLVLPPLIGVLSFVFLMGESGLVPRGLHLAFGLDPAVWSLRGAWGIVAVHAYSFYVFFYAFVGAALENRDPSLLEAAASLGAGRWMRFWRVTVPFLLPALMGASILVFMTSMASFSAPLLFGGELRVLSVHLYSTKLSGDLSLAAAQTVVLASVSLVFLLLLRTWSRKHRSVMPGKGARSPRRALPSGALRRLVPPVAVVLSVLALLPHLTLALLSFVRPGTWTFRLGAWLPTEYTFENYRYVVDLVAPLWHSIEMALLATLANLVLGVAIGWLLTGNRLRFGRALDALVMLPWALPGTVVAVALISAFSRPSAFSFGQVLVGSFWLLPLAYFVRNLPLVARASHAAFEQLDPSLDEAARSLGAGWWLRFRRVTFPLVAPGVLGGSVLAFVTALGEFVASVLLWVPSNQPISMAIFGEYREYHLEAAAAYGVVLVLVIGLVLVASRYALGVQSRMGIG